jgi:hypothetical protein
LIQTAIEAIEKMQTGNWKDKKKKALEELRQASEYFD